MNDLKEETLPLIVHSNGHADLCTWAEGHRELIAILPELLEERPGLHVAFMSGFSGDDFERPLNEPCLMKPFTLEELRQAIERALEI